MFELAEVMTISVSANTGLYNLDSYARQWFKQKLFRHHPAHALPSYTALYSFVYATGSAAVSAYVLYMERGTFSARTN